MKGIMYDGRSDLPMDLQSCEASAKRLLRELGKLK
jgi:hypothetical protein